MFNVRQPSDSFRIGIVVPIYVAELMRKYTTLRAADEEIK